MSIFSPLALTHALPFLPLAQGDINYQVEWRNNPQLFDRLFAQTETKIILVREGKIAVPAGQAALVDLQQARMRLATLPSTYVSQALEEYSAAVPLFLGTYGDKETSVVAVDITRINRLKASESNVVIPDSAFASADDEFEESAIECETVAHSPSLFEQAIERFDWVDIRGFAPHASAREAGEATSAATLSMWHLRQRHCPTCGAPVRSALGGWAQRCSNPSDGNRLLFPRIEPAVITSIVDSEDRLLVQHNAAWKDETFYSVSAGFVEAGENLEHACRRETFEETGVVLGELCYLGSQPWPFPASLMVAFKAYATGTEIRVDGIETADARWVSREEYMKELLSGRMSPPGKATIARYMIEEWYGSSLEGM